MDYLMNLFGLEMTLETWNGEKRLPYYFTDSYLIQKAEIGEIPCIVLSPKSQLSTLPALKKHISRIQEIEPIPVVLQLDSLSDFRRENLIENRIPFISKDNQVYLPFMATYLTKKRTMEVPSAVTCFMYSTQVLFIWYLYSRNDKLYLSEAARKLPFSNMTITRAARQLTDCGLFRAEKEGVKKILICDTPKRELYEKAKAYMVSPVVEEGYILRDDVDDGMTRAGCTALSDRTMLNPLEPVDYAVYKNDFKSKRLSKELLDPDRQVRLELWGYDPKLFAGDMGADPISVALSLRSTMDERVEGAVEEMMEEVWSKNHDWIGEL